MSCSLKPKAMIDTPTLVCFFPRKHERNHDCTYTAGPKKKLVLMGNKAFANFLRSIQSHIGKLNHMVGHLEKQTMGLTARSVGGDLNADQAARDLVKTEHELSRTRKAIEELKKFFVKIKKQWTERGTESLDTSSGHPPLVFLLLLTAIRRIFASSSSMRRSSYRISGRTCST